MRLKIAKKEAKETSYWLRLLEIESDDFENQRLKLIKEVNELVSILGSILTKSL